MLSVDNLPALNAVLNGTAGILLVIGYFYIRQGNMAAHKKVMISAFVVSSIFLISYLIYHAHAGSTKFLGTGFIRPVYFSILISHIILAAVIVPMAIITMFRGLKARYDKHKRIARWTLPVWLYVSVTGVIIYVMLYHLYPHS
jgi:putative membrane protein